MAVQPARRCVHLRRRGPPPSAALLSLACVSACSAALAFLPGGALCGGRPAPPRGARTARRQAAPGAQPTAPALAPEAVVRRLPVEGTPPWKWRRALLLRVAALGRGGSATPLDDRKVQRLGEKLRAAALEDPALAVSLPRDLPDLEGRWKLLYSSGFVRNSTARLGGLRVGPNMDSPIFEVGDIHQVFRTREQTADTEVTLRAPRWLRDTGLLGSLPFSSGRPDTVLTLRQNFQVAAEGVLRFAFSDGQLKSRLFDQLGALRFPLVPWGLSADVATDGPLTDTLTTTYCDGDLRLGVGGRFGEFRVFQRA